MKEAENNLARNWVKYGTICGLISSGTYILLNVFANIPGIVFPRSIFRIALFAIGVFGVISVGGAYHLFKKYKNSVLLQMAVLLSVLAFSFFTLMMVLQQANLIFWEEALESNQVNEHTNSIWAAIHTVQLGVDITFDIFYTMTFIFYSILMFKHPRYGKIFSISGILLFTSLLVFNMITFPHPPNSAGLVDIGPLTGLWGVVVSIQALRSVKWMDQD